MMRSTDGKSRSQRGEWAQRLFLPWGLLILSGLAAYREERARRQPKEGLSPQEAGGGQSGSGATVTQNHNVRFQLPDCPGPGNRRPCTWSNLGPAWYGSNTLEKQISGHRNFTFRPYIIPIYIGPWSVITRHTRKPDSMSENQQKQTIKADL